MLVKKPYTIQKATILKYDNNNMLLRVIKVEEMLSVEFKFSAIGESLDEIEENFDNYRLHKISEIKKENRPLYVYTDFADKDLKAYTELLIKIKNQEILTKELISFYKYETAETDNFWWDFDNHTMFSYDEKFMKNIHKYVDYLIRYRQGTFKPPA